MPNDVKFAIPFLPRPQTAQILAAIQLANLHAFQQLALQRQARRSEIALRSMLSEAVSDWAILAVHLGPPLSLLSRISERSSP